MSGDRRSLWTRWLCASRCPALLGAAVALFAACRPASRDGREAAGPSAQAAPTTSSASGSAVGSAVGANDTPQSGDAGGAGWVRYTGVSARCGLSLPATRDAFPEPLAWEGCPAEAGLPGACRALSAIGPTTAGMPPFGPWVKVKPHGGRVYAMVTRFAPPFATRMVADVDGEVTFAVREDGPRCTLGRYDLAGDRFVFQVYGDHDAGAVGGRLGSWSPTVVVHAATGSPVSYAASEAGIVQVSADQRIDLLSWKDGSKLVEMGSPVSDEGREQALPFGAASNVFWTRSGPRAMNPRVFAHGARADLLVTDDTFVGDLGTDGVDMVWAESSRPDASAATVFSARSSTEATTLERTKREVTRLSRTVVGVHPFVVGCGHAARALDGDEGITLVRLRDGARWTLRGSGKAWSFQTPLALTCDELFATAWTPDGTRTTRVTLADVTARAPEGG